MILIVFLYSFLYYNCLSDKTCSDDDKSCSSQALISSYLSFQQEAIYVYSTNQKYQGNLAAYGATEEESLQNICRGEKLLSGLVNQFCPNVQAFVSTANAPLFDYASEYGVPTTVPIYGPTGILLSDNWTTFFGSATILKSTLSAAGLGSELFWTFADSTGGQGTDCLNGTTTDSESPGSIGTPNSTSLDWINPTISNSASCDQSLRVLCICYIAGESVAQ
ncbi:hypothetical protein CH362_14785 [Leptospira saintgironsiae]|uniref:DUF1554 domain-containing protein n=1 Tax=Leptospira saintgironsiae TaxID=2023183 RepID=A0A2M9YA76_9LEPT|nr:hypothetical protein CH362_14785 [Leptospira saintgironsiae]